MYGWEKSYFCFDFKIGLLRSWQGLKAHLVESFGSLNWDLANGINHINSSQIVVTNVKFYLFMSKIVLMLQVSSTLLTMFLIYYGNMWYSWFWINLMMI
jgi:hypothetical protein